MAPSDSPNRIAWLQGPSAKCDAVPQCYSRPWRLVLLGAPGVGKGTQADLLNRRLHACHLSTGDVFRSAESRPDPSPAMAEALTHMRRGELVPDETVWKIVSERTGCLKCAGGFILDGFPRTLAQAVSLQSMLANHEVPLHAVLNYSLPTDEIVKRLAGRRTCQKCKAVYNVNNRPPRLENHCDRCDGSLFQRDDDQPESIQVRLEAYHASTEPLIEYYKKLDLLVQVDGTGSAEDIFARTILNLGSVRHVEFSRELWVYGQE